VIIEDTIAGIAAMKKNSPDSLEESKASDLSDVDEIDEPPDADADQSRRHRSTHMPLWKYFDRGEMVSTTGSSRVRWAVCKACSRKIQGQAPTMKTHIMRCYAQDEQAKRECSGGGSLTKRSVSSTQLTTKREREDENEAEEDRFVARPKAGIPENSSREGQTSTMLAVVLDEETGEPECRSMPMVKLDGSLGTARIRVLLAALCSTDLALVEGYKNSPRNMILGHEFVGIVDQIMPLNEASGMGDIKVGDRVCAEINCTEPGQCGDWKVRAQHGERSALGIFGAHGVFAEFVKVPLENIHKVPPGISDRAAVFAEPLAAACQVLEETQLRRDEKVAVLGAGKLGSLIAGVLAASMFDVSVLIRPSQDGTFSCPDHLRSITGRRLAVRNSMEEADNAYDCIVECTGSPGGLQRALALVKPRGTIVLKSTYSPTKGGSGDLDMSAVVVKEVKVIGSRCGPFKVALRMLEDRFITPEGLISAEYRLAEAKEAFRHAATSKVLKVLLRP
jgi:threonine dehydrogenase-like Zn-dependent dehydrogenase